MQNNPMPQNGTPEGQTKSSSESAQQRESGQPNNHATSALKEGIAAGARDISTEVKHIAGDVVGEAKKVADSKLDAGKDAAAQRLGSVAEALRQTSRQLEPGDSTLTEYVEKAARSVDKVSEYLRTRTLSQLIGDIEGFARREPAVFLGGSFIAGLLGGRFFKAATPARPRNLRGPSAQDQNWNDLAHAYSDEDRANAYSSQRSARLGQGYAQSGSPQYEPMRRATQRPSIDQTRLGALAGSSSTPNGSTADPKGTERR